MSTVGPSGQQPDGNGGRRFGSLARVCLWLGLISVAFIIFVIFAPIDPWFHEATRQAREVDNLFRFMLAASGVIVIYVEGLTLAFALQYRRRKSDPDSAIGSLVHGNTRLETAWSVAPSVLLVILAVVSLRVLSDEKTRQPNELHLDVTAYQYGYAFSLPQYGVKNASTVVLPVNRPVYVAEHSRDVIHAFWVPHFRIQYDAVPGIVTTERFVPTEKGRFPVICTQYCGSGHSLMNGELPGGPVISVGSEADFVNYLRKNGAKTLPTGATTAALVQR